MHNSIKQVLYPQGFVKIV